LGWRARPAALEQATPTSGIENIPRVGEVQPESVSCPSSALQLRRGEQRPQRVGTELFALRPLARDQDHVFVVCCGGRDVFSFAEEHFSHLREVPGSAVSLDGFWVGRWDRTRGRRADRRWRRGDATIVESNARIYVLYATSPTISSSRSGSATG
jgi:hypothetical protein